MSYCKQEGKDQIIFVTEEDQKGPAAVSIAFDDGDDTPVGLIDDDGEINWSCPCLGGMATGPCGVEFRDAFTCFHYSTEDPKGSDCLGPFRQMSECMAEYPNVYGSGSKEEKEEAPSETSAESSTADVSESKTSTADVSESKTETKAST